MAAKRGPSFDDTSMGGAAGAFPQTHWSAILACRDRSDPQWCRRMESLIRLYWRPVYRHIRMGWRLGNEEAKDLTQAFFEQILEGRFFKHVDESRGRFRTFVKVCLENFLRQEHRDSHRLRRGGRLDFISIESGGEKEGTLPLASAAPSPEQVLDRQWRHAITEQALTRLEEGCARDGRSLQFEVFRRHDLADPAAGRPSHAQIARDLGITETDVSNYLSRIRTRLLEAAQEVVRESVSSPEALRQEMRELFPGEETPAA